MTRSPFSRTEWYYYILLGAAGGLLLVAVDELAFAQVDIGENRDAEACWSRAANGSLTVTNIFEDCGYKEDYLVAAIAPWSWITGGYFGMILVSVFVLISYIRYRNWVYPAIVGSMYLPVSYYMFPEHFVTTAILFMFVGVGTAIWLVMVRQTKEHD